MNTEKQLGTIWSYNPARCVGTIIDSENRRYFFHSCRVISGPPFLTLGADVRFVIDSRQPVQTGKLPIAREIEILEAAKPAEEFHTGAAQLVKDGGAL
jgi:hypothetical protein